MMAYREQRILTTDITTTRSKRPDDDDSPSPQTTGEPKSATKRGAVASMARGSNFLISIVGPIGVYFLLHSAFRVSEVWSLTAGAGVAAANTVYGAIRRGRIDGISVLVMVELVISIILIVVTRSPRVLLLKPAVSIAVIGFYVLSTCIRGRPTAYQTTLPAIAQGDSAQAAAYERAWITSGEFRRRLRAISAIWGISFLIDAAAGFYFVITASMRMRTYSARRESSEGVKGARNAGIREATMASMMIRLKDINKMPGRAACPSPDPRLEEIKWIISETRK
jgi:hypothetical protein